MVFFRVARFAGSFRKRSRAGRPRWSMRPYALVFLPHRYHPFFQPPDDRINRFFHFSIPRFRLIYRIDARSFGRARWRKRIAEVPVRAENSSEK